MNQYIRVKCPVCGHDNHIMKGDIWDCLGCKSVINDELEVVITDDGNRIEYISENVEYCEGCDTYFTEEEASFTFVDGGEKKICEHCIDAREEHKHQMQELYREP